MRCGCNLKHLLNSDMSVLSFCIPFGSSRKSVRMWFTELLSLVELKREERYDLDSK